MIVRILCLRAVAIRDEAPCDQYRAIQDFVVSCYEDRPCIDPLFAQSAQKGSHTCDGAFQSVFSGFKMSLLALP